MIFFSISKNLLLKMNECKRVFDFDTKSNLNYYAYWLRQMDSHLSKLDLRKLPITSIYNVF